MDIDTFLERVNATDFKLPVPVTDAVRGRSPETMDALFHLPLLALAVMVIARSMSFPTVHLGRNVSRLLIEHFTALRNAPHGLETSVTMRRRCAEALAFLEAARLVTIAQDHHRNVTLSEEGKNHMDRASRDGTDLGLLVRRLRVSQERVTARVGDER